MRRELEMEKDWFDKLVDAVIVAGIIGVVMMFAFIGYLGGTL